MRTEGFIHNFIKYLYFNKFSKQTSPILFLNKVMFI